MSFSVSREGSGDTLLRADVDVVTGAGSEKSASIVRHGFDERQLRAVAAQIESLMRMLPAESGGASHTVPQSIPQSIQQAAKAIAKSLGFTY